MKEFCTCTSHDCKLHPRNHDQGCTLCIRKNLKTREIPSCYFNLLPGSEGRRGDSLEDFARLVLGKGD